MLMRCAGFIQKPEIMKTRTITICGKEITFAYCYATEIMFAKLNGSTIENFDTQNPEHLMHLVLASIISYSEAEGKEQPITDRELLYNAQPQELIAAVNVIYELRGEWYNVPKTEQEEKEDEGDKGKN